MATIGQIRLIGDHHASHHHGEHLTVTDNPAIVNPQVVHRNHAENLVARGEAEWVTRWPAPETPEQQAERHAREHREMLGKHYREHHALLKQQEATHRKTIAEVEDAANTVSQLARALKALKGAANGNPPATG